ncbi:TPA: hypothetical protein KDZ97_004539 [Vibrio parahaemolyticus]|uniref:hypothetical protein n=1 Tax=Vibrio parahaemolyticus TaxID=670 RepID=UPI001B812B93|nr:hypothetical protein [Vibrio parahaemolyticus]MDF5646529.1 hypothetical protein [Vibrio parahaemolyticus]HBC3539985.1 hypothetical protein [Vibrio parahaemolyticus]HBC3816404.1 hypothetical protein [Vibrio parahaemolyticus]
MSQKIMFNAKTTQNCIDHQPNNIESDDLVVEVTPSNVINLFTYIAAEFGNGDLTYSFDGETMTLLIDINGVNGSIAVGDLDPYQTWDANSTTDFFALRAILSVDPKHLNELNRTHPNTKFYLDGNNILAEEAFYLTYGVTTLNVLDRFSAFVKTVNATF